jgi:hypothetical protein
MIQDTTALVSSDIYCRVSMQHTLTRKSRETGNIWYTRRGKPKNQKHNIICVRYHYSQTNTNLCKHDRILILSNTLANNHCNVLLLYLTVNVCCIDTLQYMSDVTYEMGMTQMHVSSVRFVFRSRRH